ncbi:MAG: hypothetical protein EOM73_09785, partial [Bacteroidia bacterium]|nr:hypothetical protein [Bacteroidia bacterium]
LHVGAGTFRPVQSETLEGHAMHREKVIITKKVLEEFLTETRKIIAVGTTSVRSLESLYWLGLQLENGNQFSSLPEISQWEPYENQPKITVRKAMENLLNSPHTKAELADGLKDLKEDTIEFFAGEDEEKASQYAEAFEEAYKKGGKPAFKQNISEFND